jgi:sulfur carrier protein
MELTIRNEKEQTTQVHHFTGKTVGQLLTELQINVETVLVVRNSEVLLEDELLNNQDTIELLSVISGG